MVNSINTLGLRVETVVPSSYDSNVDINTQIILIFNSDLDTGSIVGNFVVLKDKDGIYNGEDIQIDNYEIVKGTVTYKNKSIIFTPSNQLDKYCRYIIYVKKNTIKDIHGKVLLQDFISNFDTEIIETVKKTSIIEPLNNSILSSLDSVTIEDVESERYLLQISKQQTFENIVLDTIVSTNVINKEFNLGDGLYYIRAKAMNGNFGDFNVFTIKTHKNTAPTDQDLDEDYIYEPVEIDEIESIGNYPEGINVNEKTNLIYVKFKGLIDIDDIDFYESNLFGELSDSEDFGTISEHGEVDGSYSIVHDEEANETYVFFIPNSI